MKTPVRFILVFAAVGFLVPLAFRLIWYFLNQFPNLEVHYWTQQIMVMLFPSSLMTLPVSDEPGFEITLLLWAIATNVILYAILGGVVWLGLRKHVLFLGVAGVALAAAWWRLLTL